MTNDLDSTRELLSQQLAQAVATDPVGAIPIITAIQNDTDKQLKEAVRHAAMSSSWSEIAAALGVSKQAAHQRFKSYAKDVAGEIKTHQRAMNQARHNGDSEQAAKERARRDELAAQLRTAAKALKAYK